MTINKESKQMAGVVAAVIGVSTLVYFVGSAKDNETEVEVLAKVEEPVVEVVKSIHEYSPSGYLVVPYPLCDDMLSAFYYANKVLGDSAKDNYFIWRGGMFSADRIENN